MLEIRTANLKTRKRVLIDDHEYVVRRLGAGDELALSQIIRQTEALIKKAQKVGKLTEAEDRQFADMQEKSLKIYAGTFDDGGDGSQSLALVSNLSYDERSLLYEQIFAEAKKEGDATDAAKDKAAA